MRRRRLERALLRHVVPNRKRLGLAFDLLALAQRLRLDRLAAKLLPARLGAARALLPPIPPRYQRRAPTPLLPAHGERRGRVGFLTGCVMAELFPTPTRRRCACSRAMASTWWCRPTRAAAARSTRTRATRTPRERSRAATSTRSRTCTS
jgi:glycolate oxidase iron-sulfur subunit